MNNFEDIIKEIYFQIKNVKDEGAEPYYLFLAEEVYVIMKVEICKDNSLFPAPEGRFDFFEGLEVVHMRGMTSNYIEVRGIRPQHAI
jgi:hypothetical protein